MKNIKTHGTSIEWSNVLEMVHESRIDSVGLNERVNSLATRSIKRDSKLLMHQKILKVLRNK